MRRAILGLLTVFFLSVFTVPTLVSTFEQKPVTFEYREPRSVSRPKFKKEATERRQYHYKPQKRVVPTLYDRFCGLAELFANLFGIFTGIWFAVELVRKRRKKED